MTTAVSDLLNHHHNKCLRYLVEQLLRPAANMMHSQAAASGSIRDLSLVTDGQSRTAKDFFCNQTLMDGDAWDQCPVGRSGDTQPSAS